MGLTGDNRQEAYLGDGERFPLGAQTLLNQYLKNVKDRRRRGEDGGPRSPPMGPAIRSTEEHQADRVVSMWRALALLLILRLPLRRRRARKRLRRSLNTEINTLFPDNTTGIITPNALRQVTLDQVASFANTASVNSFLSLQTFLAGWAVTEHFLHLLEPLPLVRRCLT